MLESALQWVKVPRHWRVLLAAIVLLALGQLLDHVLQNTGAIKFLVSVNDGAREELSSVDALRVTSVFYEHLTDPANSHDGTKYRFVDPDGFVVDETEGGVHRFVYATFRSIWLTGTQIVEEGTVIGLVLLGLSTVVSFLSLIQLARGPFSFVLVLALVPLVAGLLTLVLKLTLIACTWAFSVVLWFVPYAYFTWKAVSDFKGKYQIANKRIK